MHEDIHALVDEWFVRDAEVYGRDLAPYHGHVHRVAELTASQLDLRPGWAELIAHAAYWHDAAIWFDHTWDYLPGSSSRAARDVAEPWQQELVTAMVDEHHRIRHARNPHPLVEAMRRSDATDVYRVVMPPRVSRADYRALLRRVPDAGFHAMLGRGFLLGLREHARLNPMPMVKW